MLHDIALYKFNIHIHKGNLLNVTQSNSIITKDV